MNSKILLLILLSVLISSCARSNFYEHQILSALPAEAHSHAVDIYAGTDSIPREDYLEYYDLRLVQKGMRSDDKRMMLLLKTEARKKGLDAVMTIQKFDERDYDAYNAADFLLDMLGSEPDNETYVNYGIIEARGIKYVKNIDLSKSVKTGKVFDTQTDTQVGEIKYLPNGLIAETVAESDDSEMLLNTYFKFSEDYLLREEADWQTLHHADGRIDVRRKFQGADTVLARVRVKYQQDYSQRIKSLRLTEKFGSSPAKVAKVRYEYNNKSQVIKRSISGKYKMIQNISYNNGLIKETTLRYQGKNYRIVYDFYQQSDLKELIIKAEEPVSDNLSPISNGHTTKF